MKLESGSPPSSAEVQASADRPRTCATCFVTSSYPGMTIGDDGRCMLCGTKTERAKSVRGMRDLHAAADELKHKKRGKYDCLIGASGGLDSSYVILVAKRDLGLNPLVVRYDAGFSHVQAERNLETICRRLDVDRRIVRSPAKHDFKYIRSTVRALRHIDAYFGLCEFCTYMLPAVTHRCAVAEQVPAILTSQNDFEVNLPLSGTFKIRYMANAIRKRIWKLPPVLLHLALARYHLLRLKLEFYVPPARNLLTKFPVMANPVPKLCLSDFIEWDITHIIERLQREVGWQRSGHPDIGMRFDCKLEDGFVNHTCRKAYGLTSHAIVACHLIHGGVRTKPEMADAVDYYNEVIPDMTEEVLKQLGLE